MIQTSIRHGSSFDGATDDQLCMDMNTVDDLLHSGHIELFSLMNLLIAEAFKRGLISCKCSMWGHDIREFAEHDSEGNITNWKEWFYGATQSG